MLVKELIKFLEKIDENALVLLASDEEGNNFSKLAIGFGYAQDKEEKDLMYQTGGVYGLSKEENDKDWLLLYPEL